MKLSNIKHKSWLKLLHILHYSQRDISNTLVEAVFKLVQTVFKAFKLQSVWLKYHVVNNVTRVVRLIFDSLT